MSDLQVLNPSKRRTYSDFPNNVVRLAKQLHQLQLTDKLNELKTEAIDFRMADAVELPTEDDVDSFSAAMHGVKGMGSATPTYANLLTLVRALLVQPASNADSERCFSIVRRIDTKESGHLHCSTIGSLLCLKLNVNDECHEFQPSPELMELNQSVVRQCNEEYGSYSGPTASSSRTQD